MKICGISDIHGDLSVKIQPCDVLCICGDIVPLEVQVNSKKSKRWLKELFIPWCSKQPCKKVLVVGGNHDFFLWHHPLQMKEMVKEEEVPTPSHEVAEAENPTEETVAQPQSSTANDTLEETVAANVRKATAARMRRNSNGQFCGKMDD